ncbi:acyltransferase family protein [Mammaliicoccus sciuri]|nr:acyltransferase family protein [Mammaliicoccus sciuri]WQL32859.1 acyltransferase family protein [Mammaliicoccus sciuri]
MKYYKEIPVIRAIAAIMIVIVHLTANSYHRDNIFANDWLGYLNQISRLGTPIFAIISAFLLTASVLNRGFDLKYFVKSRFSKIFIPYLIWTSFYLSYRYFYLHNKENFVLHFKPLEELLNNQAFLFNWIFYFMLGIALAKYYSEFQEFIIKYKKVLSVCIGIMFVDLIISIDINNLFTSIHSYNLIYIPLFFIFLTYIYSYIEKEPILFNILTLIGNYSMGIYLVHVFVMYTLKRTKLFENIGETYMFVPTLISILSVSIFIVFLISKLPYGNYIVPIPKKKTKSKKFKSPISTMDSNIGRS